MGDPKETTLTFSQRVWLAIIPALVTSSVVVVGVAVQWFLFVQKTEVDQAQLQQKLIADQRQFREKLDADHKQAMRAIQASQEQSDRIRAKEFRLRFYERQLAFYLELCDTTTHLANAESPQDASKYIDRFYGVVFGNLLIMSDKPLESLVATFATEYARLLDKPAERIPLAKRQRLLVLSGAIAKTCRISLERAFDLDQKTFGDWQPIHSSDTPTPARQRAS
jgi:hypothetical protein